MKHFFKIKVRFFYKNFRFKSQTGEYLVAANTEAEAKDIMQHFLDDLIEHPRIETTEYNEKEKKWVTIASREISKEESHLVSTSILQIKDTPIRDFIGDSQDSIYIALARVEVADPADDTQSVEVYRSYAIGAKDFLHASLILRIALEDLYHRIHGDTNKENLKHMYYHTQDIISLKNTLLTLIPNNIQTIEGDNNAHTKQALATIDSIYKDINLDFDKLMVDDQYLYRNKYCPIIEKY